MKKLFTKPAVPWQQPKSSPPCPTSLKSYSEGSPNQLTRDNRVLVSNSWLCLTGCKARLGEICSPTTIMAGCQQFKTYHQSRQPPPFWFHSIPGRRGKLPAAIGQCYPKLRLLAAGNGVGVPRLALLSLPTSLPRNFYHYLLSSTILHGTHTLPHH